MNTINEKGIASSINGISKYFDNIPNKNDNNSTNTISITTSNVNGDNKIKTPSSSIMINDNKQRKNKVLKTQVRSTNTSNFITSKHLNPHGSLITNTAILKPLNINQPLILEKIMLFLFVKHKNNLQLLRCRQICL